MTSWIADDNRRDRHAQPEALQDDEDQRRQRLAAELGEGDEGVRDEAAERLHLVLDHGCDFRRLDPLEVAGREAQHLVDQFETDAPQHAFAEPALVGVDVELEDTVDDDQPQEDEAQAHQRLGAVEFESVKEMKIAEKRQVDVDRHEWLRGPRRLEPFALDRAVDDLLRQVERHEIRDHRQGDDEDDPELLPPGMGPDVAGKASSMDVSEPRAGQPGKRAVRREGADREKCHVRMHEFRLKRLWIASSSAPAYNSRIMDATQARYADEDWHEHAFDLARGIAVYCGSPLVKGLSRVISHYPQADIGNAFNHKQVACKMWARDRLFERVGGVFGEIWIVGGWYGVLAAMLLDDQRFKIGRIENSDIDPAVR